MVQKLLNVLKWLMTGIMCVFSVWCVFFVIDGKTPIFIQKEVINTKEMQEVEVAQAKHSIIVTREELNEKATGTPNTSENNKDVSKQDKTNSEEKSEELDSVVITPTSELEVPEILTDEELERKREQTIINNDVDPDMLARLEAGEFSGSDEENIKEEKEETEESEEIEESEQQNVGYSEEEIAARLNAFLIESKVERNKGLKAMSNFEVLNISSDAFTCNTFLLADKPIVVVAWNKASMLDNWVSIYEEYKKEVDFIFIYMTKLNELPATVYESVKDLGLPIYFDTMLSFKLAQNPKKYPTMYLVNSDGYIIYKTNSKFSNIAEKIDELVKKNEELLQSRNDASAEFMRAELEEKNKQLSLETGGVVVENVEDDYKK